MSDFYTSTFGVGFNGRVAGNFRRQICIDFDKQQSHQKKFFDEKENGVTLLNDNSRKLFLNNWQEKKREVIMHPFLEEKIMWGLVPYAQALLLARCIRGDLEEYPAFLWK